MSHVRGRGQADLPASDRGRVAEAELQLLRLGRRLQQVRLGMAAPGDRQPAETRRERGQRRARPGIQAHLHAPFLGRGAGAAPTRSCRVVASAWSWKPPTSTSEAARAPVPARAIKAPAAIATPRLQRTVITPSCHTREQMTDVSL